jgi:hypothetical protein
VYTQKDMQHDLTDRGRYVLDMIRRQPGHRYSRRSKHWSTVRALQDLGLTRLVSYRVGSARYEITEQGRAALISTH